jgi:hypothetical protein
MVQLKQIGIIWFSANPVLSVMKLVAKAGKLGVPSN